MVNDIPPRSLEDVMPETCSPRVAADMLGVCEMTIRKWIKNGTIPRVKMDGNTRLVRVSVKWLLEACSEEKREEQTDFVKQNIFWSAKMKDCVRLLVQALLAEAVLKKQEERAAHLKGQLDGR